MLPKAVIFGCASTTLSPAEKGFFQRVNPLGFILFERNCHSPLQVQELVYSLRESVQRPDAPILLDHEGGRVWRLRWSEAAPPSALFGRIAEDNIGLATHSIQDHSWLMGKELARLGITVNCAPVVDVWDEQGHEVIGDRAFSSDPQLVATLAFHAIQGFYQAGIIPVIKHLPGHGRAQADSHEEMPFIEVPEADLIQRDFLAFRTLCHHLALSSNMPAPWGMTAHIIYKAIDAQAPATHSYQAIHHIIRRYMGFSGLLLTDCLAMKALKGSFSLRAERAFAAGCDIALHCTGKLEEMIDVATAAPFLSEEAFQRFQKSIPFSSSLDQPGLEDKVRHRLQKTFELYR